jgi:putative SOS response-associated peptidase YedK
MCGRYTSTSSISDLAEVFEVDEVRAQPLPARYNVAPTDPVYAVAISKAPEPHRALGAFRWGLVPSWAKDPSVGNRMINARAEGIEAKPAYRRALERRRCLIPADAFYEWQKRTRADGKPAGKLPYAVRLKDGRPMALAGLWEIWRDPADPDAEPLRTCVIITTEANDLMAPIHDRMPVILARDDWTAWLDPDRGGDKVTGLLVPAPSEWFDVFPVSSLVNKVANDGPELLEPVPEPPARP